MANSSTAEITGGCACGAIRYQTSATPQFSFHCKCRQCQRAGGGGHSSAFILPLAETVVIGAPHFYEQSSDTGNIVSRGFCSHCGSPVWNRNSGYPDNIYIHAATLDDPSTFSPSRTLFAEFGCTWDVTDPALEA